MEKIKDLFHFYETTVSFMTHKNLNIIPLDSIAFLCQTGQLYVQGHILGVSTEEFEALKKEVLNIQQIFSSGDGEAAVDSIVKIVSFLEGYNEGEKLQTIIDKINNTIDNHIKDTDNPHKVTKEQIGLGNVDNTADADKPVSKAVTEALKNCVTFDDASSEEKSGVMTTENFIKLREIEERATQDSPITENELTQILIS